MRPADLANACRAAGREEHGSCRNSLPGGTESATPRSAAPCACSKGQSGTLCNRSLGRQGDFWQHESYDHVVRDEREYERILAYIVNNPVKAGLVADWQDWPYTYVKL